MGLRIAFAVPHFHRAMIIYGLAESSERVKEDDAIEVCRSLQTKYSGSLLWCNLSLLKLVNYWWLKKFQNYPP